MQTDDFFRARLDQMIDCRRAFKFDHLCALNFDQV